MKSVILKVILVLISKISLIQLAENETKKDKKNFRNFIKDNHNKTNSDRISDVNIFESSEEKDNDKKEKFNFDNIILNLSIIENKIKSFKNKLESKFNLF